MAKKDRPTLENLGISKCCCCDKPLDKEPYYVFMIKHSCVRDPKNTLSTIIHKEWERKKNEPKPE